mmetsp:Transcript_16299/g.40565  ORF Transcript_16299/g.40565 Transcript_16299/m.40565 type:complete len:227 (-) Transcript_16299:661-1341(-)
MGKDASVTPKATLNVNSIGPGFGKSNVGAGGIATLKWKRSKFNASLALSDGTLKSVKSLKDVVLTADYKAPKGVTVNSKYEAGPKKYQVGATWDGNVAKKATTLKAWYSNKDNLVAGEATVNVAKGQKANVTFNQKKVLTAKYTYTKGDYTAEPSYNFTRKAPAVAVTKKLGSKDTLKVSYDIKSEGAAAEWARKPFKVTLSSSVSKKLQVGKPSLSAIFENVYEF